VKRPEGFDRATEEPPARSGSNEAGSAHPSRASGTAAVRAPKPPKPPRERREKSPVVAPVRSPEQVRKATERAERRAKRDEARRFTRNSRRRRATWITVGAIFVVLVAVLAVAIFSPILALRTIRIEGADAVKASSVRSALDDQLGTPLALLDTGQIDRDLAQFTLIRSYVTEIVPPNTLVVRIEERQAIGVVANGDIYDEVDPAGVVLGKSATRGKLPVIDIGDAKLGGAAFDAAVKVLLAMPASVSDQVSSVSATTLDNVSLTLTGVKHTVIWGSSANSEAKAQVLSVMLKTAQCRSLPVLNVTAPEVVSCGKQLPIPKPTTSPTSTPTATATATPAG
jgi:cell division protein FtsQ